MVGKIWGVFTERELGFDVKVVRGRVEIDRWWDGAGRIPVIRIFSRACETLYRWRARKCIA